MTFQSIRDRKWEQKIEQWKMKVLTVELWLVQDSKEMSKDVPAPLVFLEDEDKFQRNKDTQWISKLQKMVNPKGNRRVNPLSFKPA